MALTYISALAKAKGYGKRWENVDLVSRSFTDIFSSYAQVYLRIHDSYSTLTKDLLLTSNRSLIVNMEQTVSQWLLQMTNISLPYEPNLVKVQSKQALFCNGNLANFRPRHISHEYGPNVDVPLSERRDMLVRKDGIDPNDLFRYCLFTVNGLFHRTALTGAGVVIKEGGASQQRANNFHFGILDFERIGEVHQYPITEDNLFQEDNVPLSQSAFIKSPVPLEGKSALVIIGGYLFTGINDAIRYIGNDVIHVDMARVSLLERIYESNQLLDMEFLKDYLQHSTPFEYLKPQEVLSNDFAKAYLTLPQSFIVVVDTLDLVAYTQQLENDKIFGMFITTTKPNSLMQIGYRRCEDYWWQRDGGRYVLYANPLKENFAFPNHEWRNEPLVGRMLDVEKSVINDTPYFLHLQAEEIVPTAL